MISKISISNGTFNSFANHVVVPFMHRLEIKYFLYVIIMMKCLIFLCTQTGEQVKHVAQDAMDSVKNTLGIGQNQK